MKIAIAGYGAEGESNYRYWNQAEHQVVIVDEQSPSRTPPIDASVIIGEHAFARLAGYDMVVRTAGLAPHKIKTDGQIWSATNEFFVRCPAPIIGVTGSKGKGTTSSFITSILEAAGKTVHLVGNIGVPALDILDRIAADEIVVYELSSFQLWDITRSPHIAVVLMIEPDHLDVHSSLEEYIAAKANIVKFQTPADVVIYNATNRHATSIANSSLAQKIGYPSAMHAHIADDAIWYGEHYLCSIDAVTLPGVHNLENALAAINAIWPFVQDADVIKRGLTNFTGLPHRLKFIRQVNGVSYYDDSIATTPGSAIAAIKAFKESKIIILGGSSKGANFHELAGVARQNDVKLAITIGDEADRIESMLLAEGIAVVNLGSKVTLDEVAKVAQSYTQSGDVVILSPACASFDMFKNYSDRGDQFVRAVSQL
jgi:UDP-N-acetylmuramoylalanine--D-glutamate ligase